MRIYLDTAQNSFRRHCYQKGVPSSFLVKKFDDSAFDGYNLSDSYQYNQGSCRAIPVSPTILRKMIHAKNVWMGA
jgi:hypothetical protein